MIISIVIVTVRVPDRSWPTSYLLVPVNSTVLINCTTDRSSPHWSIDLPVAHIVTSINFLLPDGIMLLNEYGLYQLHNREDIIEEQPFTLRLLINNTQLSNQTVVKCVGENQAILATTLFVYGTSIEFRCH